MNNEFSQMSAKNPYLAAVVVAGLFFLAGQYIASQPQRAQKEAELNREITVQGQGEITAKPDVAKITLAVQTDTLPTAEAATSELAKKFQNVLAALKKAGVEDKDVKTTNLSVNPLYDYVNGKQNQIGFQANESIYVTIRKLDNVSTIVGQATAQGVNQIGGVSFEIDDPDNLKIQAQEKAIDNAKEKAQQLAKALGVSLGKVKTFSVNDGSQPIPMYATLEKSAGGVGGDVAGPPVAPGENIVQANVSVTYELK